MNNKRRERLRNALKMLDSAASIVESVCDEEQDCIDNCPENLQNTDRFERQEDAVDSLSDAMGKIDEAKEQITSAIG